MIMALKAGAASAKAGKPVSKANNGFMFLGRTNILKYNFPASNRCGKVSILNLRAITEQVNVYY
jgi:hypothetical protein